MDQINTQSSSMAPSLTANSFLLTTTPHTHVTSLKTRRFIVCVKKSDTDSDTPNPNLKNLNLNLSQFQLNFEFSKVSDVRSLIPDVSKTASSATVFGKRKDPNMAFVGGGTGLAGIRIVQRLLREGFSVRAGVPELGAAQDLRGWRLIIRSSPLKNPNV